MRAQRKQRDKTRIRKDPRNENRAPFGILPKPIENKPSIAVEEAKENLARTWLIAHGHGDKVRAHDATAKATTIKTAYKEKDLILGPKKEEEPILATGPSVIRKSKKKKMKRKQQ